MNILSCLNAWIAVIGNVIKGNHLSMSVCLIDKCKDYNTTYLMWLENISRSVDNLIWLVRSHRMCCTMSGCEGQRQLCWSQLDRSIINHSFCNIADVDCFLLFFTFRWQNYICLSRCDVFNHKNVSHYQSASDRIFQTCPGNKFF